MTPAFRYLVGKLYTAQKQIYHAGKKLPEGNRPLRLDPGWDRVSYLVAIELQLHRATVESYGMYAATLEGGLPESERQAEEILLRCLSVRMEEQASKTGELEIDTDCRMPGLREGVPGKPGI